MEILTNIADKIGFDWKLSLTNLINFLIIFFLLVKFALPAIKKTVEERTAKIKEGLKLREEADTVIALATEKSKSITQEASKRAEEIISKNEQNAKAVVQSANEKASETIRAADLEKAQAKNSGLKEAENILNKELPQILAGISTKAFASKVNAEVNSEFVNNVFKL